MLDTLTDICLVIYCIMVILAFFKMLDVGELCHQLSDVSLLTYLLVNQ